MENNQEPVIEAELIEAKRSLKEILKEQSANIAIGVATLALTAWGAYDNHKRNNRKEEKYNSYLDSKLELLEDSVSSYKDSLLDARPEDPKELKD